MTRMASCGSMKQRGIRSSREAGMERTWRTVGSGSDGMEASDRALPAKVRVMNRAWLLGTLAALALPAATAHAEIAFAPCPAAPELQCGRVTVPLDRSG